MKRTGPTNIHLKQLVIELRRTAASEKTAIWSRLANELERPTREKREVNLFRLNKHTKPGEIIVVPGKVLATGELNHKLDVAAFNFSGTAKEKIMKNGKCLTIYELMKKEPKGKNIRILG